MFIYFYLWCFFSYCVYSKCWLMKQHMGILCWKVFFNRWDFSNFWFAFCLFYSCLIFTKKWTAYWLTVVSCLGSWGQAPSKRRIVWRPPLEGLSFAIAMRQRPGEPWLLWRPSSHAVHFRSSRGQVTNKNPAKATGRNHFHQRSGSMKVDGSRDTW